MYLIWLSANDVFLIGVYSWFLSISVSWIVFFSLISCYFAELGSKHGALHMLERALSQTSTSSAPVCFWYWCLRHRHIFWIQVLCQILSCGPGFPKKVLLTITIEFWSDIVFVSFISFVVTAFFIQLKKSLAKYNKSVLLCKFVFWDKVSHVAQFELLMF